MASGLAKEAEVVPTVGFDRIYSDGRSGKDKCSDGKTPTARGRVFSKEPIHYGCG